MSTIFADKFKNTSGGNPVQINQLRGIDTAGSITVQGEGTATTNLQQGLAKVWCNFNGTTGASNDTLNVASMTDNGTGNHTININNDFSNALYSATTTGSEGNTNDNVVILSTSASGFSAGSITVFIFADDSGIFDPVNNEPMCVTLHGDLA